MCKKLDEILALVHSARRWLIPYRELGKCVEPDVPDLNVLAREKRKHAADVVGVDVRHDDEVDHTLASGERVDTRLQCLCSLGGSPVEDHPPRSTLACTLDPDRVAVGGLQKIDRDSCGDAISFALGVE